jgi:hypothetical protein
MLAPFLARSTRADDVARIQRSARIGSDTDDVIDRGGRLAAVGTRRLLGPDAVS